MRRAIAGVLTGLHGLGWDEAREKPVDRLTALAASQNKRANEAMEAAFLRSLGQDLIAFRDSLRADMQASAVAKLAEAFHGRREFANLKPQQRTRIAAWAVQERVVDMCPSCSGAQEVPQFAGEEGYQPMEPCAACSGTGKRRYTNAERIAAMGQPFAKQMQEAHRIIATAEGMAVEGAVRLLRGWGSK